MVGDALFTVGEGRPSPVSSGYMEAHRNMTPSKTVRPNVNQFTADEMRRMDIFDDPVTFVRELSSVSLGVPEFSKYEKNVYRCRYLNSPDCYSLLNVHYANLTSRYAPKLTSLLSHRSEVTLSTLSQSSLFSSDHLKSLAVLVILGSHHSLDLEGLSAYLLNVTRLLYRAATSSKVDPVDKSRTFYSFLTKSEGMGRAVLLYMLLLSALEKLLWFSEGEVPEDDMFAVFSYMICCFVEDALNGEVPEYTPQKTGMVPPLSSKMDMLVRHFSVVAFILKLKAPLPNSSVLLTCVRAFRNKLESGPRNNSLVLWTSIISLYLDHDEVAACSFKNPKCLFDVFKYSNSVLEFTQAVSCLEYCFKDHKFCSYAEYNLNIQKFVNLFLFNIWRLIKNYKDDLANEMLLLTNSILEVLPKTLPDLAKYISQFPYKEKGESLLMNNLADKDAKLSEWVQKSMESIFNVALFGKSRIQMSATLLLSKLLLNSDVTRSLPRVNKMNYTKLMLEILYTKGHADVSSYYHKDYSMDAYNRASYSGGYGSAYLSENKRSDPLYEDNFVSDLARLTLMRAYMKYCWNDLVSCLMSKLDQKLFEYKKTQNKYAATDKNYNYGARYDDKHFNYIDKYKDKSKADRNSGKQAGEDKALDSDVAWVLNYIKNEHLGSSGKDTLYSMLSSGTFPAKMLSYETLMGISPAAETLVMCGMMSLFNRYSNFSSLFNKYLSMKRFGLSNLDKMMYPSMNGSGMALNGRNWSSYTLELLDNLVTRFVEGCDLSRQKLVNSLLAAPTVSELDREKCTQLEKAVRDYKSETSRLRQDYDRLALESSSKKEEYEHTVSKLKAEMTSVTERSKNELQKMKELVSKTNGTLQQLEQMLNSAKSEVSNLKQENSRIYTERDNLKSEMSSLKTKLTHQQRELDRLPALIRENDTKSNQNKKLQMELDRKNEELVQCNNNLERLYQMLICLADKYKSSMENHERMKEEVKSLNHQMAQLISKLNSLESDVKDKERMISDLSRQKNASEQELTRLRDEVVRKEEAISSANKKAKEYKEKVDSLSHALQKRTETLSNIEHRYAEVERELAQRRHQLSAIESAFHSRPL